MPEFGTIAHLIELAIQGERWNQAFYQRLATKFTAHPAVTNFWTRYAGEENGHARWIEGLRSRLEPAQLAAKADLDILHRAERVVNQPLDEIMENIHNLQEAYDRANELEHSETNVVFDFLIGYFATDPQTQAFLRAQLSEHVSRLVMEFPEPFRNASMRKSVEAAAS